MLKDGGKSSANKRGDPVYKEVLRVNIFILKYNIIIIDVFIFLYYHHHIIISKSSTNKRGYPVHKEVLGVFGSAQNKNVLH